MTIDSSPERRGEMVKPAMANSKSHDLSLRSPGSKCTEFGKVYHDDDETLEEPPMLLPAGQSFHLQHPSNTRVPLGNHSWESSFSYSENEEGGGRRKDYDSTTPTLVDEDDEGEEEMVCLEEERVKRRSQEEHGKELRRTPGATMLYSTSSLSASTSSFERNTILRRTPGASAMHRSAAAPVAMSTPASARPPPSVDTSVLGFGLTLSTPVGTDHRSPRHASLGRDQDDQERSAFKSCSPTSRTIPMQSSESLTRRPPRAPSSTARESSSYTPASMVLTKNPHLRMEHKNGSFSPNTLRLADSLDNLLNETDAHNEANRSRVLTGDFTSLKFGATEQKKHEGNRPGSADSWSDIYTCDDMKPRRSRGSSRRREGSKRRSDQVQRRSSDGSGRGTPSPVNAVSTTRNLEKPGDRNVATPVHNVNHPLSSGQLESSDIEDYKIESPQPMPLNFGGAFVPTAKKGAGEYRRPVPSTPRPAPTAYPSQAPTYMETRVHYQHQMQLPHEVDTQPEYIMPKGETAPQIVVHHHHLYTGYTPSVPIHAQGGGIASQPLMAHEMHYYPSQHHSSNNFDYAHHQYDPSFSGMNSHPPFFPPPFPMEHSLAHAQDFHPMLEMHPSVQNPWSGQPLMPYHHESSAQSGGWGPGGVYDGWGSACDSIAYHPAVGPKVHGAPTLSPPTVPQYNDLMENSNSFRPMHIPHEGAVAQIESDQQLPRGNVMISRSQLTENDQFHADRKSPAVPRRKNSEESRSTISSFPSKQQQRKSSKSDSTGIVVSQARQKKSASTTNESLVQTGETVPFRGQSKQKKKATTSPNKPRQRKGRSKSPDDTANSENCAKNKKTVENGAPEDPVDAKLAALVESPATRSMFKEFYRNFRAKERISFEVAEEFAARSLVDDSLPENVHWKVFLELADLAKRANKFQESRRLYRHVCCIQPYASHGWLEYSKLEEESGNTERCSKILQLGLEHCEFNENLLSRSIKLEEKTGNIERARQLLARLKHAGIEQVWRTVLEGALLEVRAGNHEMARRVLKYLMHHVPWYGPLYLEAYRLERDLGRAKDALVVVERGLDAIPRYGPLWFGAFRLCESIDLASKEYTLPKAMGLVRRATKSISRELIWKVHLDSAQMLERVAFRMMEASEVEMRKAYPMLLQECKRRFAMTVLTCPANLCWKVWLAAGRMELVCGRVDVARKVCLKAYNVVPDKGCAAVLLECARLEEFIGKNDLSRAILCKARSDAGSDWKVWLESVMLEIRSGQRDRALSLANRALERHPGTGRLWAALVQLRHANGEIVQSQCLKHALSCVPKSGEVWCEGARIHLNPFVPTFDIGQARLYLTFATRFTPQYGDSFVETVRLEVLTRWIFPVAKLIIDATANRWVKVSEVRESQGGRVNDAFFIAMEALGHTDSSKTLSEEDSELSEEIRSCFQNGLANAASYLSSLFLLCSNADPNYGTLWFHCRQGPTDTARDILGRATDKIVEDLVAYAPWYIAAIARQCFVCNETNEKLGMRYAGIGSVDMVPLQLEKLRNAPLLGSMIRGSVELLESSALGSDFVTGIVCLNRFQSLETLSAVERRKSLFGSDSVLA